MSNLAQGVFDYGVERGILSDIKNLSSSTGWSIEKTMQMLCVPESERQKFLDMLNDDSGAGRD